MSFTYRPFLHSDLMALVASGVRAPYGRPSSWVTSEEWAAQLVCWGGRGSSPDKENDPPDSYLLVLRGKFIHFEAWRRAIYSPDGYLYTIEVQRFQHSDGICDLPDDVKHMIRLGLDALWKGMESSPVKEVEVQFLSRQAVDGRSNDKT